MEEARSLFWVYQFGTGFQDAGPLTVAFLAHKQEAGWKDKQLGHELVSILDSGAKKWRIIQLSHHAGPLARILFKISGSMIIMDIGR